MSTIEEKPELSAEAFDACLSARSIQIEPAQKSPILETARWLDRGMTALKRAYPDLAKTKR